MLNLNYDSKYDILNIIWSDSSNSIGCDEYDGLVVMRDFESKEITGLMLYDFVNKYKSGRLPDFPDGISINVEKDVIPAFPIACLHKQQSL